MQTGFKLKNIYYRCLDFHTNEKMIILKLKSSKQLNALVLFSWITSEIFQLIHRYRYQFVGQVMTDM